MAACSPTAGPFHLSRFAVSESLMYPVYLQKFGWGQHLAQVPLIAGLRGLPPLSDAEKEELMNAADDEGDEPGNGSSMVSEQICSAQ